MTALISGLSQLADRYDVVLSDVWGVIHNGREHFPIPCAALAEWKAQVGPVVLISNSPRSSDDFARQMDSFGVPRATWSNFVTSGAATRVLLAELAPGPAWSIGLDPGGLLYEGLGLSFAGPDHAAFISCVGLDNDEVETAEDYRDRLALCAARALPMVCANPDKVVHRGEKLIVCGGALADLYGELGGHAAMAGKPYAPVYDLALAQAQEALGRPVDRSRVLCIGDGLPTDVAGANAQGLDCLFIAGGIHRDVLQPGALHDALDHLLADRGLTAAYVMPSLSW
ncbi:MAG: family HAD-type hydrolase [Caulobacteraceae bacterium]|nr:family HAD-type hydrolase [Caulobacteraceae bacterium]